MDKDRELATRQIAMVRETGECNMFDSICVQRTANEMKLYALVNLIGDTRDRSRLRNSGYTDCLFASGEIGEEDLTPVEHYIIRHRRKQLNEDYDDGDGYSDDDLGHDDFPMSLEYSGAYGLDPTGES